MLTTIQSKDFDAAYILECWWMTETVHKDNVGYFACHLNSSEIPLCSSYCMTVEEIVERAQYMEYEVGFCATLEWKGVVV